MYLRRMKPIGTPSEPHNRPGKLCGPDLIRGTNISRTTFREVDAEYLERSVSWHYRGLLRANGSCWTVVERLEVLPLLWVSGKRNLEARLRASSRTRVYIEHYLILSYLISVVDKTVKLRRYFKFSRSSIYPKIVSKFDLWILGRRKVFEFEIN